MCRHQGAGPGDITLGPDGNLWFTEIYGNKIGRISNILEAPIAPQPEGPIAPIQDATQDPAIVNIQAPNTGVGPASSTSIHPIALVLIALAIGILTLGGYRRYKIE